MQGSNSCNFHLILKRQPLCLLSQIGFWLTGSTPDCELHFSSRWAQAPGQLLWKDKPYASAYMKLSMKNIKTCSLHPSAQ